MYYSRHEFLQKHLNHTVYRNFMQLRHYIQKEKQMSVILASQIAVLGLVLSGLSG